MMQVKKLSSNETMKHEQFIMGNEIPKVLDKNDTDAVHTMETCTNKIYKCKNCEKYFKSYFALCKHKTTKSHMLKTS